jgi:hypothetical protein
MLGWICEKMATQALAPGGGRYFAFGSTIVGNDALACSDPCAPSEDCSIATGNNSWDNAHTSNSSSTGERLSRDRRLDQLGG